MSQRRTSERVRESMARRPPIEVITLGDTSSDEGDQSEMEVDVDSPQDHNQSTSIPMSLGPSATSPCQQPSASIGQLSTPVQEPSTPIGQPPTPIQAPPTPLAQPSTPSRLNHTQIPAIRTQISSHGKQISNKSPRHSQPVGSRPNPTKAIARKQVGQQRSLSQQAPNSQEPSERPSRENRAEFMSERCNSLKARLKQRKLHLEKIIGAFRLDEQVYFVVKWKGLIQPERVALTDLRLLFPDQVLDYMCQKIKWADRICPSD